jgi:hypothetical protein
MPCPITNPKTLRPRPAQKEKNAEEENGVFYLFFWALFFSLFYYLSISNAT